MFKLLRKLPFCNKIFRNILLLLQKTSYKLSSKWRISGVAKAQFAEISFKMYSQCDDFMLEPIFYNQPFIEEADLSIFLKLCENNFTVFDVGANSGFYSILPALKSSTVSVHSFEPNPTNLKRLRTNVVLNNANNITIVPKAIGDKISKISFTIPTNEQLCYESSAIEDFSKSFHQGKIEWKNVEVEQTTIDHYIEESNIAQLNLIKIDVEGYEINALEGAQKTIELHKPIILLESFVDESKRNYLESFVKKHNYHIYVIVKEGLILSHSFDNNNGLNYLLLHKKAQTNFIPINKVKSLSQFSLA